MSTTTFKPVNSSLQDTTSPQDLQDDDDTPITPRPAPARLSNSHDVAAGRQNVLSLPGQRPLPTSPFTFSSQPETRTLLHRGGSNNSAQSTHNDESMDVDASENDQDGSDNDMENDDPTRSSKKKKGQKFFCTEFPPCNLSFTRSEHLARHIRKHTGERPFQCHCNRRFSRLDNLRQHAQTVHVNEDIPAESLAATGTRYQRQIRTERLRPPSSRARSGNVGTQNNLHRGHSRNPSTSSIGSTVSGYGTAEARRRPPPLLMATDGSARPQLALDTPATPPAHYQAYAANSPGGMTTPTSATYSANPSSPGFGSFTESPISATSRVAGLYGIRTPSRRLSVPSSANAFQSPHGHAQPHSYMSPVSSATSQFSNSTSHFPSPTSPHFSSSHAAAEAAAADADPRRATWHPSSYVSGGSSYSRPPTSGLSFSQTPDTMQPAPIPSSTGAAAQAPRLPGIESFDRIQHRPSTPPRRQPSPMQIDSQPPPRPLTNHATSYHPGSRIPDHRRGHFSWDGSHSARSRRPDLYTSLSRDASSWSSKPLDGIPDVASRSASQNAPTMAYRPGQIAVRHESQQHPSFDQKLQIRPSTPQRSRGGGWHGNGLVRGNSHGTQPVRTSPEDSSSSEGVPTPGMLAAEVHPAIVHSNGYIEPQPHHPPPHLEPSHNTCVASSGATPNHRPPPREQVSAPSYFADRSQAHHDMGRLEALVAVATSEDKAATSAR